MKIYMMGDSTMKFNNYFSYPQTGWGQVLHIFAKNHVLIEDHAENGRSTKSFIDEGRFDVILNKLNKGDYVICQFGHNDEKKQDPNRYTEPFGSYQDNLAYFAKKALERGANIVYATPITRHKFENGVCVNTHGDYPKAMLEYCKNNGFTCIDMNQLSIDLYNKLGEEATKRFHMIFKPNRYTNYLEGKDDHSHLVYEGAIMIAELFVREILKSDNKIKECFIDLNNADPIDWAMLID